MGASSRSPRRLDDFGLAPLYAIVDAESWGRHRVAEVAARVVRLGVGCLQLRVKDCPSAEVADLARQCLRALADRPVHFWINDHVDVARELGATGVHLGQTDEPPASARRRLGPGQLIGRSTHDLEQVEQAQRDGDVDVVAFGPVFPTRSKKDPDPVVGLEGLRRARGGVSKPLVAIGGIDSERAGSALRAGADSVAVIGALARPDLDGGVRALLAATRRGARIAFSRQIGDN